MGSTTTDDLITAMSFGANATGFGFPVYKDEDGHRTLYEVIEVSSYQQVPDGRWCVRHGQLSRCAEENVWLKEPLDDEEAWKEYDRRTTFRSLAQAVLAARARQDETQERYTPKEKK